MPTHSRAHSTSVSDLAGATMRDRDGVCAAGQAQKRLPNIGDTRLKNAVSTEDREALKRLIEAGKMIRRDDGRYGTASKPLITGAIAARLKARNLAVSGYDKLKTMYPSDKGKRLYQEMKNDGGS